MNCIIWRLVRLPGKQLSVEQTAGREINKGKKYKNDYC